MTPPEREPIATPPVDAPDPAEVLAALTREVDKIFYDAGARISEVGDMHQMSIIPDPSEILREPVSNPGPHPEYYQRMMERGFGYDGSI